MLRLDYTLHEHGWAHASIGDGGCTVDFEVSYLSDALGDLARAARGILRGLPSATVGFQQEPGEHRLTLTRQADRVSATVERFHHNFSRKHQRGESVLTTESGLLELAEEVVNCLFRVLAAHGENEYLARWKRAPFPSTEYRELLEIRAELAA